ncbi:MAG: hypothetical protein EKK61_02245 [Rickettsiales bacterium]|nr:MAG: hypothetical protein EKK61_02245 [Rickettsiales bacterium]
MIFLDFLLLIMIIICVGYCWMLSKRIQDLQNSRVEFARMIKELNVSIVKAENNVNEMSRLSQVTSNQIKNVVEEANEVSKELTSLSELAIELVNKLYNQVQTTEQYINNPGSLELDIYNNVLSSKPKEKFTEEDLAPIEEEKVEIKYKDHLKNFLNNIVSKKTNELSSNMNQMNYYNTLRKINAKK